MIFEEEALFFVGLAVSTAFTMYGVDGCTEIEDDFAVGCCIVQNIVLAGLGVAIASTFFSAALVAFFMTGGADTVQSRELTVRHQRRERTCSRR